MTQIFSHNFAATENFTAAGATIMWSSKGHSNPDHFPILLTNLTAQYSRNINPITPINTDRLGRFTKVNIIGAPTGVLQCDGLITDTSGDLEDFLDAVNQGCGEDQDVRFTIRPFTAAGCDSQLKYIIKGLTLQSFVLNIQTTEVTIVRQPLSFVFTSLEYDYNEK